jgi:hypothetical protein
MSSTRCQVCKVVLFTGDHDPYDHYTSGRGGWPSDQPPIAVCLGSWRNLWRRLWYHQACCGVYGDAVNAAGRWFVFGFTAPAGAADAPPGLIRIAGAVYRSAPPPKPPAQE